MGHRHDPSTDNYIAFNNTGQGWWDGAEAAKTVCKGNDKGGGGARESTVVVAAPLTSPRSGAGGSYRTDDNDASGNHIVVQTRSSNVGVEDDLTGALGSNADRASGSAPMVLAFDTTQITHPENRSRPDDRSPQLSESGHPPAIAFAADDYASCTFEECDAARPLTASPDRSRAAPIIAFSSKDHGTDAGDVAPTLRSMDFDKSHANGGGQVAIAFQTRVARNGRGGGAEIVPALSGADAGATSDMAVRGDLGPYRRRRQGRPGPGSVRGCRGEAADSERM